MKDVSVPVPGGSINVWHRPAAPDSPTVVLIHGLTGTSRWWGRVIDALPEEMGVIAHDVRGRGGSSEAPPPFDLSTAAEDITRSLDHFGIERAVVAGYSMGAWIVSLFAQQQPERIERLILVDGGVPMPFDAELGADRFIDAVVGPSLARLELTFANQDEFIDYWKSHPALTGYWDDAMTTPLTFELIDTADGYRVRINPDAVRECARQITVDTTTNNAAAEVQVPTHLIVVERGTADQDGGMIPLEAARRTADSLPNMTLEDLEDLNHYTLVLGDGHAIVASRIAGL